MNHTRFHRIGCLLLVCGGFLLFAACTSDTPPKELTIYAWLHDGSGNPVYEPLILNEPREIYPQSKLGQTGVNITCEFDGVIQISVDKNDIQIDWGDVDDQHAVMFNSNTVYGYDYRTVNQATVSANFLTAPPYENGFPGQEHLINVTTYELLNEDAPVIRAQIKFIQLDDEPVSEAYSVELISCEYTQNY